MTGYLLDVNVLIALVDTEHVQHELAHEWFDAEGKKAWATCPITENGFLRILGSSRYPSSPGNPATVAELIEDLFAMDGHVFWPEEISIFDHRHIRRSRLLNSAQITDSYLLALAVVNRGKLATFDRRLVTNAVVGGADALHTIA